MAKTVDGTPECFRVLSPLISEMLSGVISIFNRWRILWREMLFSKDISCLAASNVD